jgi:hypothetical protein
MGGPIKLLISSRSVNKLGRHSQFLFLKSILEAEWAEPVSLTFPIFHRCFPPNFGSFGSTVLEKIFRNRQRLLISFRFVYKHGRHSQFLFLIGRFLKIFSSETALPIEPKLGRKHLPMDRDEMSNLYRGPYVDGSFHLAEHFQRRN